MNKKSIILISISIIFIIGSPYIPDVFFEVFRFRTQTLYDPMFIEHRMKEVIPSIRLAGIVVAILGFKLYNRKEK